MSEQQQQQTNGAGDESSAHARRANLFSKWRQRDRVAGATTETNNNIDISASAGSNSIKPTNISNSPSKRGSAPSLSSISSAAARAELDIGGSIGSSRKSTGSSSSRHRSRSRPRDGKTSSTSSRHRSKSRGKSSKSDISESESTSTAAPTPSRGVEREESLRDYWKRRAEESKERITTGSGSVHSNNSSSWGEKMNNEDGSNKSSSTSGQHQPPPPPRGSVSSESRSSSRRTTGSSRARSKSRGRSEKNVTSKAPTTPPGRKVDSIASALVGHSHRKSTTQQQLQSTSSSRNLLPQSISVDDNNDKSNSTEDLQSSALSPLHQSLATASWSDLYTHLTGLSKIEDKVGLSEIAATLSQPHPKYGGTVLHVASWKAPPALAIQMIRLMPKESREMSVLQSIRDGEGNTPLHLCAGNLDLRPGTSTTTSSGEEEKVEIDHLGVLREIVSSTTGDSSKSWTVQNSEGDTPLHMLVSSPLCTAEFNKNSKEPSPTNEVKEKLAKEAITLALSTPEGIEACLLQERTGGTPLHIALASGAHDCVIEALLSASPASARIEDSRGMLPLHWAGAFGKANYSMVKKLVEEYPKALISCTVDGDIPLHLAVSNALLEEDSAGGGRSWEGDNSTRVDKVSD